MTREEKQEKFAKEAYKAKNGILLLSIRFGKTATGIRLLEHWLAPKTLIVYPDSNIKEGWLKEFERMDYSNPNITFTTNMSLNKYEDEIYDIIIIDEIHTLSERNINSVKALQKQNKTIIGLTGTLAKETRETLLNELGMPVIAEYGKEEAIEDGIVSDYRINIVKVPLDDRKLIKYKKGLKTEKKQFDSYTFVINKLKEKNKPFMFLALSRMRIIQNSIAKLEATKKLLREFKDERVLVFCGLIKIAEQLGIPVEHSKGGEGNLKEFSEGNGNHLALIKLGNTGITFKPLNKVIINYFDSNSENLEQKIGRAMNLEFEGQVADIWVICTTEGVEKRWLENALKGFNSEKIKYL